MINKITKIVVLMLLVFTCSYSFAQDAKELKARMLERIPAIQALKSKGIIGENNLGYLQFVSSGKEQEGLVNSENADRKAVYTAIANQQGASADLVGKRRAIQIAENAGAGEWLQDNAGKWYQKK
ncbi:MAG: YdbL family protein [Pseudomonadota bacterium]|nr:YdbL family protein [Pseudomonadota bacterium]